jgi:hypothetical protein
MKTRSRRVFFNNFQAKFSNNVTHKVIVLTCVFPDRKFYDNGAVYALSYPIHLYTLHAVVIDLGGFSQFLV